MGCNCKGAKVVAPTEESPTGTYRWAVPLLDGSGSTYFGIDQKAAAVEHATRIGSTVVPVPAD